MFKLTFEWAELQLDINALDRNVHEFASQLLRHGVKKGLAKGHRFIPVDTGMAAATWRAAAASVGLILPIRSFRTRRVLKPTRNNYSKTPQGGEAHQSYNLSLGPKIYSFSFSIDLLHFVLNELYKIKSNMNASRRPWRTFKLVQIGFKAGVREALHESKELINPKDFIIVTRRSTR